MFRRSTPLCSCRSYSKCACSSKASINSFFQYCPDPHVPCARCKHLLHSSMTPALENPCLVTVYSLVGVASAPPERGALASIGSDIGALSSSTLQPFPLPTRFHPRISLNHGKWTRVGLTPSTGVISIIGRVRDARSPYRGPILFPMIRHWLAASPTTCTCWFPFRLLGRRWRHI